MIRKQLLRLKSPRPSAATQSLRIRHASHIIYIYIYIRGDHALSLLVHCGIPAGRASIVTKQIHACLTDSRVDARRPGVGALTAGMCGCPCLCLQPLDRFQPLLCAGVMWPLPAWVGIFARMSRWRSIFCHQHCMYACTCTTSYQALYCFLCATHAQLRTCTNTYETHQSCQQLYNLELCVSNSCTKVSYHINLELIRVAPCHRSIAAVALSATLLVHQYVL